MVGCTFSYVYMYEYSLIFSIILASAWSYDIASVLLSNLYFFLKHIVIDFLFYG